MREDRSAAQFWQSVFLRLIAIWLIGWGTILWFQGCLVPAARDEALRDQQKIAPSVPQPTKD
ncbi:unnamed protein product [Gemmata massiliana]|uniref:Uncharacterized protein n=1 Tax=Gemmata massiliana TaxID=1210884 RepID=A0A6P2D2A2_9BACT|nr:hypothetical protein [Gemmata massiliana]VTR95458.1 unnamed protein product [Gemmata massiliana]